MSEDAARERVVQIADKSVRYRPMQIAPGLEFEVPEYILRMPQGDAWQLRYGDWTRFPDKDSSKTDPAASLARAVEEMEFRLNSFGK